jgi:hypothetical protein
MHDLFCHVRAAASHSMRDHELHHFQLPINGQSMGNNGPGISQCLVRHFELFEAVMFAVHRCIRFRLRAWHIGRPMDLIAAILAKIRNIILAGKLTCDQVNKRLSIR